MKAMSAARGSLGLLGCAILSCGVPVTAGAESVARVWNEELLAAIRRDFPAPTVHARNLYHVSAAMWDAWAAYDDRAVGVFHNEVAEAPGDDVAAAREVAVSHAAYQVLRARYALAVDPVTTLAALDARMASLGLDASVTTTSGPTPAAVGNRCAGAVLAFGLSDGANEAAAYADTTGYGAVNDPLILAFSGTGTLDVPNRWQPLAFEVAFTQNGLIAQKVQTFVSPHWGYVAPFALNGAWADGVYLGVDPGAPPQLAGPGDSEFKANTLEVVGFSSRLDPGDGEVIDISPGARGNNTLGSNDGAGHPVNPVTGLPYPPNEVLHADFGRVIAEFWADGPDSETPPGHWNTLANSLHAHPLFERRLGGVGDEVDELEWDVKVYLALNGAVHDAAVAAWGIKAHYDYVRPITSIRHLGGLGQSSDPGGPSYHPSGLPLVPGLVEVVTFDSSRPGQRHDHLAGSIGRVAIRAWTGEPANPETQFGGVDWILARDWLPYQRDTFVTPAFAGYVSGHSTFSRAAAEVLTAATGTPFFPGGLGTWTVPQGHLEFEFGPSEDVELQWATYYDASDEAGISRLYGGIHVAPDDGPGRILGARIGLASWEKAARYFDGRVLEDFAAELVENGGAFELRWNCLPGFRYKVQRSADLVGFDDVTGFTEYDSFTASFPVESPPSRLFYRVVVEGPAPVVD